MQIKHLIIFALAGIAILIGFNVVNSNRHESRVEEVAITAPPPSPDTATSSEDTAIATTATTDIASQPLGKQPKAIIDNATAQIEQAEQLNQERVEQMSDAQ